MHSLNPAFSTAFAPKSDPAFDDLAAALGDPRPQPGEEALVQLGRALMTELLDVIAARRWRTSRRSSAKP